MDVVHYVRCYAYGNRLNARTYELLPIEDARRMVAAGTAKTVNRGKAIQMRFSAVPDPQTNDETCYWPARLMEAVVAGESRARAAINMIDPRLGRIDRIRIVAA